VKYLSNAYMFSKAEGKNSTGIAGIKNAGLKK